uniref:Uncharacterized protein n=1 Tax=Karlodinium veneficum TaxID=407301 RepID=A7WQ08_KARVE|nr:unknown [Karlodinium veneficum]
MGAAECCLEREDETQNGDLLVSQFLERLTPLEVSTGLATLSLVEAELPDSGDHITIDLDRFALAGLILTGSIRVTVIGAEIGARVVVDVEKPLDSDRATVQVKAFTVKDKGMKLTEKALSIDSLKHFVCNRLEGKINDEIMSRCKSQLDGRQENDAEPLDEHG